MESIGCRSLKVGQHHQLINWASNYSRHVLHLSEKVDRWKAKNALNVAEEWVQGNNSFDEARKASLCAIAVANTDMADHSLGKC